MGGRSTLCTVSIEKHKLFHEIYSLHFPIRGQEDIFALYLCGQIIKSQKLSRGTWRGWSQTKMALRSLPWLLAGETLFPRWWWGHKIYSSETSCVLYLTFLSFLLSQHYPSLFSHSLQPPFSLLSTLPLFFLFSTLPLFLSSLPFSCPFSLSFFNNCLLLPTILGPTLGTTLLFTNGFLVPYSFLIFHCFNRNFKDLLWFQLPNLKKNKSNLFILIQKTFIQLL